MFLYNTRYVLHLKLHVRANQTVRNCKFMRVKSLRYLLFLYESRSRISIQFTKESIKTIPITRLKANTKY